MVRRRTGEPPTEPGTPAEPTKPAVGDVPAETDLAAEPRAGEIGPVRREIIFEPVHERPAPVPVEPSPATPETRPEQPAEPVPAAP